MSQHSVIGSAGHMGTSPGIATGDLHSFQCVAQRQEAVLSEQPSTSYSTLLRALLATALSSGDRYPSLQKSHLGLRVGHCSDPSCSSATKLAHQGHNIPLLVIFLIHLIAVSAQSVVYQTPIVGPNWRGTRFRNKICHRSMAE